MVEMEPDIERVGLGRSTRGRRNGMYKGSTWGINLECWRSRQPELCLGRRAREIRPEEQGCEERMEV